MTTPSIIWNVPFIVTISGSFINTYLKSTNLTTATVIPLIRAEAFRWHRPWSTTPFTSKISSPTWILPSRKALPLGLSPTTKVLIFVRSLLPARLIPKPLGPLGSSRTINWPLRSPYFFWIFSEIQIEARWNDVVHSRFLRLFLFSVEKLLLVNRKEIRRIT